MSGESYINQAFIQKLTDIIHANLEHENFGVDELARESGMSRSAIYHRLLAITEKSTTQFIREVRLQRAMELLQQESTTASEVAYKVGFGSPAYFNTCFHEYFGYPPGEVLKNFKKDQAESDNSLTPESVEQENRPLPESTKKRGWTVSGNWVAFIGGLTLLIVIGLVFVFKNVIIKQSNSVSLTRLKNSDKSIAVLPFKNISNDQNDQYFADGIMESILNHLYKVRELRVIPRTSVERFRESKISAPEIAKILGVNFILEGSVLQYEGKVRVMVKLIDARHDEYILTEQYDRNFEDIFIIQSNIAKLVAEKLQTVLTAKEKETIEKIATKNTEAYNLYLMGRFFWNKRTEEGVKKSIEYFEKAVQKDPDYALAWAGLADGYSILAGYGWSASKKEGRDKAKKCITEACNLDNNLAEAHASLGRMLIYQDRKWEEAEKELILAISLNPNLATAHQYYSQLLDIFGEYEKAREQINLALELDPLSLIMHRLSSTYYYNEGNFFEALKENQEALSLDKNYKNTHWGNFYIYYRLGDGGKALDELQKIFLQDTTTLKYVDMTRSVFAKSGLKGLIDWMNEILPNSARIYALAGKKEQALTCLEKYLENAEGDEIVRIINALDYETLRSEPRFKAVVDKLGLTKYYLKRLHQPGYIKNH